MTEVLQVDADRPDPRAIERAAAVLRAGGLVAFPTETVYGLGVHALDRAAVRRLFAAKERPAGDPLIVHVTSVDEAIPLVAHLPETARVLAARFWPGPLTLVLRRSPQVPDEVTAGLETVAVRVPSHPVARAILARAGVPVAAPSANLFGRPSPTRAVHVLQDLDGRIDLVVDAGPTGVGVESTVLDLARTPPVILRPGAVTLEMLREVIPDVAGPPAPSPADSALPDAAGPAMPSPGLLTRHYAPRAPFTLYSGDPDAARARLVDDAREAVARGARVGLLLTSEDGGISAAVGGGPAIHVAELGSEREPAVIAARLYTALRELDAAGADLILGRIVPQRAEGLGLAIQDRLRRAAAGRIVEC